MSKLCVAALSLSQAVKQSKLLISIMSNPPGARFVRKPLCVSRNKFRSFKGWLRSDSSRLSI